MATTRGKNYTLSFWVGSVYDPSGQGVFGSYGTLSKVDVFINGVQLTSAFETGTQGNSTQSWKQFSTTFVATSDHTKIAFLKTTEATYNVGLDDVKLVTGQ